MVGARHNAKAAPAMENTAQTAMDVGVQHVGFGEPAEAVLASLNRVDAAFIEGLGIVTHQASHESRGRSLRVSKLVSQGSRSSQFTGDD